MPTYISLVNYTDKGIRNVKDTLDRHDKAIKQAEEKYRSQLKTYWLLGPYDMVAVIEAPDVQSAAARALELSSLGNRRSITFRAYDREEMSRILERIEPPTYT